MAGKSIVDVALENIDTQIASLQMAKQIILDAAEENAPDAPQPKVKRTRGKNKPKPGLPVVPKDDGTGMSKDEKAWVG